MKTVTVLLALFIVTAVHAGNNTSDCASTVGETVKEMVGNATPFENFDLEGTAVLSFIIDENNTIHISEIRSTNPFLRNHILDTLQNKSAGCNSFERNKVYVVKLRYIQYA